MFKSIELNKEFETQRELFLAIKENVKKIISIKKSQVYKSIDKGQLTGNHIITREVSKGISTKENFIYPVINTTDFLDSHLDNHQKGIWKKTIKEQAGKIRYSMDHSNKIADVVAWQEDVSMKTEVLDWTDLGFDFVGKTEALIFSINKNNIDNENALKIINKKRPIENSVSMRYVKIELAIDSEDKEFKKEKSLWDATIDSVANKDFAKEQKIMWIVKEAQIVHESSMVTKGSNGATTTIYANKEAEIITSDKETQAEKSLNHENEAYLEALKLFIN